MDETAWVETPYEFPLNVRYGEVGHDGVATLFSLANWLQEAAGQSASSLGFGEEDLAPLGLTWILTRLVLRIRRLPASGEAIRVHTWPSTLARFGHRGYEVYDGSGSLIVSGGSAWNVMDLPSRSLVAVPPELAAVYPAHPRPCDAFTCRVLPRLPETDERHAVPLRVRRDDLDINGHVNNARYLSWLVEPLPLQKMSSTLQALSAARGGTSTLRLVDITFRTECFPGDELSSLCAPAADGESESEVLGLPAPFRLVHAIRSGSHAQNGQEGGQDVCRAVSLWAKNPFAA